MKTIEKPSSITELTFTEIRSGEWFRPVNTAQYGATVYFKLDNNRVLALDGAGQTTTHTWSHRVSPSTALEKLDLTVDQITISVKPR